MFRPTEIKVKFIFLIVQKSFFLKSRETLSDYFGFKRIKKLIVATGSA